MHAELVRVAGGTLSGTNAGAFQRYAEGFLGPNSRRRYASLMAGWVATIIRSDHAGVYFPFALTYTGLLSPSGGITRFFHACVDASRNIFPELSRSNSRRHHSDKSVGVIVIPCVSASGLIHWHGFIRIPALAMKGTPDAVSFVIQDDTVHTLISGPHALRTFAATLRDQFHPHPGVSTSLWIENQTPSDGRRQEAADHIRYPHVCHRSLAYLQNTADGEVRDWTGTAFLPHAVFRRVVGPNSTPMYRSAR
jgi:hypothetical protein